MTKPKEMPAAAATPDTSHFPFWPFAYMSYAEHIGRDYQRHLAELSRAASGVEMVKSENAYDAHLMADMTKAFYNLAVSPWRIMLAPLGGQVRRPLHRHRRRQIAVPVRG